MRRKTGATQRLKNGLRQGCSAIYLMQVVLTSFSTTKIHAVSSESWMLSTVSCAGMRTGCMTRMRIHSLEVGEDSPPRIDR